MQVFDAIALSAKNDKQLRKLAEYIFNAMPLTMKVDVSNTETKTRAINGEVYCVTAVVVTSAKTSVTVTLPNRAIWQARAYTIVGSQITYFDVQINGNVLTVPNCKSTEPVQIQII
jgi:leucyl aminopeptidase (aminopeptidase T)